MRLQKILMINRAPFDWFELDFDESNITVLSGINGAGKTTIISYIVDSCLELAKKAYANEFEGKERKYYRFSSDIYTMDRIMPSIVYLRYLLDDNSNADYIDIRGEITEELYNEFIKIENHIPFSEIKNEIENNLHTKYWSLSDNKRIMAVFSSSLMTYFPAYRYESPAFLNDPYKVSLKFKTDSDVAGYLPNPLEVISDLPQIANWIMDIVLDGQIYENSTETIRNNLNGLLTNILVSKLNTSVRLGIGKRNAGMNRISIMDATKENTQIYPSIFNMSSGELALLCLFGELVKQADKINVQPADISGIVLVDEIEKHLHIKLQKEILPKLIAMFPNVQFIVTSHSPFLSLGLEDESVSYRIIDLDKGGVDCSPQDNNLFRDVYDMMINENERYLAFCNSLQEEIKNDTKPIIITEGKTDWKHLKAAMKALNINDLDIEIYEYENAFGDQNLLKYLKSFPWIPKNRKVIGIFDRDNFSVLKCKELETQEYVIFQYGVYGFAIPLVNEDLYGKEISIEHYYKKDDLTKKTENGRRIFLGEEFNDKGLGRKEHLFTRIDGLKKKVSNNGVIDSDVFDENYDRDGLHSIALSKNDFAESILKQDEFANGFDFSEFSKIFDVIRKIIEK